jgi:uncharacterized protein YciI
MSTPQRCILLTYEYVADMQDRREPYRGDHLALIGEWKEQGLMLLAGAMADPPRAIFVLVGEHDADKFMQADPYAQNGLVVRSNTEPLVVV